MDEQALFTIRKRPMEADPDSDQIEEVRRKFVDQIVPVKIRDQTIQAHWTWVKKQFKTRWDGPLHAYNRWVLMGDGEEIALDNVGIKGFPDGLSITMLLHVYGLETVKDNEAYPKWFQEYYDQHSTQLSKPFKDARYEWNARKRRRAGDEETKLNSSSSTISAGSNALEIGPSRDGQVSVRPHRSIGPAVKIVIRRC